MVVTTAPTGLQSFLSSYEAQHPEEILHIETPVDAKFQVTAVVRELERQKRFPVLIFHNVLVDGVRSEFPLVTFLMASRQRLARLLDTSVARAGVAVRDRMQTPIPPVRVSREEAPVKEVVQTGDDADVTRFPATWHHDQDPGRYISAGFVTLYNPETGVENSAIQRGWIKGPREIPMLIGPISHNRYIVDQARREQRDLPMAYWVGHHPLAVIGCEIHGTLNHGHYATTGGVLGEALRVVPSETLGEDFLVPADAEVVIEGYIPWNETSPEGPFGEYTRHVGVGHEKAPFLRVTAVTHRRNAYWQDIMVGHSHWVSSLVHEGVMFNELKQRFPNVLNVHVPMSGCGVQHAYIQIRKTREGQGKAVLAAALGGAFHIKHAWVVDEDIDVFDDKEVLLAMSTRFQGDRDLVIISDTMAPSLDPSARKGGLGAQTGFDCTKPVGAFAERLHIPDEVAQNLNLESFISKDALDRIPIEPWG
jgi:2,5-furandicarboxylate decarboxylase 1